MLFTKFLNIYVYRCLLKLKKLILRYKNLFKCVGTNSNPRHDLINVILDAMLNFTSIQKLLSNMYVRMTKCNLIKEKKGI